MTTQELRELDAEIAQAVFGWTKWNFDNGYTNNNYLNVNGDKERANKFRKKGWIDGRQIVHLQPNYSTDPVAAMDVLKKCAEKIQSECSGKVLCFYPLAKDEWVVATVQLGNMFVQETENAPTLEQAACQFAKQLFSQTTK